MILSPEPHQLLRGCHVSPAVLSRLQAVSQKCPLHQWFLCRPLARADEYYIQIFGEVPASGRFLRAEVDRNVSVTPDSSTARAQIWTVIPFDDMSGDFVLQVSVEGTKKYLAHDREPRPGSLVYTSTIEENSARWRYSGGQIIIARGNQTPLMLSPAIGRAWARGGAAQALPRSEKPENCVYWRGETLELQTVQSLPGGIAWRFIPTTPPKVTELYSVFQCSYQSDDQPTFSLALDDTVAAAWVSYKSNPAGGSSVETWETGIWDTDIHNWYGYHVPGVHNVEARVAFSANYMAVRFSNKVIIHRKEHVAWVGMTPLAEIAVPCDTHAGVVLVAAGGDNLAVIGTWGPTDNASVGVYTLKQGSQPNMTTIVGPIVLHVAATPKALAMTADGRTLVVSIPGHIFSSVEPTVGTRAPKVAIFHQTGNASSTRPWVLETEIQPPSVSGWTFHLSLAPTIAVSGDHLAVSFATKPGSKPHLSFYRRSATGTWGLVQSILPPVPVSQIVMDGKIAAVAGPKERKIESGGAPLPRGINNLQMVVLYRWSQVQGRWRQRWVRNIPKRDSILVPPEGSTPWREGELNVYGGIALKGRTLATSAIFNFMADRSTPWTIYMQDIGI